MSKMWKNCIVDKIEYFKPNWVIVYYEQLLWLPQCFQNLYLTWTKCSLLYTESNIHVTMTIIKWNYGKRNLNLNINNDVVVKISIFFHVFSLKLLYIKPFSETFSFPIYHYTCTQNRAYSVIMSFVIDPDILYDMQSKVYIP